MKLKCTTISLLFALVMLGTSACTTRPTKESAPNHLFPEGVYEQNLEVDILKGEKSKSYSALAVLKKEKDRSSLVAMAGFGITLFKAEYKDGKIDVESFLPEDIQEKIKIFAAAILDFHNAPARVEKKNYLSRWTTLTFEETDEKRRPKTGQIKSTYFTVDFIIEAYDDAGIPKSFRLSHEKMRSLTTIENYQLQNQTKTRKN